jgi:probable HAF family extracellular repeat protein
MKRIERRHAQVGRWLMYPLIILSATALAGLAMASPPAPASAPSPAHTVYRVIPLSAAAFSGEINARGQVAFTDNLADGTQRARFYDGSVVRDIGTFGGPRSVARALNDLGQVTGLADINAEGNFHAFRWSQATGLVDLSRPGQGNSSGIDINNKGQVAGLAVFDAASGELARAFRWSPSTGMLDLGSFGGISFGQGINEAGTVIGESEVDNGGPFSQQAFRWTPTTGIQQIGTLPGEFTVANDIDRAGRIVGATPFTDLGMTHAYLWTPGEGLLDLTPGRPERSGATRINDKGLVIGDLIDVFVTFHGFIWSREHGLLELGAGQPELDTSADDLNNHGQVVGSYGNRAYVWTRRDGIVDLNTRIAHAPPGLVLTAGTAINDSGAIVARANTGLVLLVPYTAHSHAAPVSGPITVSGTARVNLMLSFAAAFKDVDLRDTHKAVWSWGDGSKDSGTVSEKNGSGNVSGEHSYRKAGIYTVKLTITDSSGKSTTVQRTVTVCGAGASLAGQGSFMSPPGAVRATASLSGLAEFAVVTAGAPNARQAQGNAAVLFNAPGLSLRSDPGATAQPDGNRVQYAGSGLLNGTTRVRFALTTLDGAGTAKDRVRVRIWHTAANGKDEVVDYDNAIVGGRAGARSAGAAVVEGAVRTDRR